jgi:pimeloyl-ACP methyl ester carboxylesterase
VIILELPGHGQAPAQADSGRFEGLARSLDDWLIKENFTGIDMVGISLGAGLVLEMARRGRAGSVVALARVGADVLPDHHNGIDCTGTGFATGASRPHAKCHRPDWIHAAAFRKTLRARSRFRLE